MMTISIIFDKSVENVLMCFHTKQGMFNFVGGHVESHENGLEGSYRELEEETGITRGDVELKFVRCESTSSAIYKPYSLYVNCGILDHEVRLREENNSLLWVPISNVKTLMDETFGNGNCLVYMREALITLGREDLLCKTEI